MCLGDMTAQLIMHPNASATVSERLSTVDFSRTLRMTTAGALTGPMGLYWFRGLDKLLPGRTFGRVVTKVTLNSFVYAPSALSVVVSVPLVLEGLSPSEIKSQFVDRVPSLWLTGSLFWPVIHVANLCLVPLVFRPPVVNLAGLAWNVYICSTTARKQIPRPLLLDGEHEHDLVRAMALAAPSPHDSRASSLENAQM